MVVVFPFSYSLSVFAVLFILPSILTQLATASASDSACVPTVSALQIYVLLLLLLLVLIF